MKAFKDKEFTRYFTKQEPPTCGTNQRKKLPIIAWWNSSKLGTYIFRIHGEIK